MPVFTFEKITPPMRRVSDTDAAAEKPRGVLPRLLDRFAESRAKRKVNAAKPAQPTPRKQAK